MLEYNILVRWIIANAEFPSPLSRSMNYAKTAATLKTDKDHFNVFNLIKMAILGLKTGVPSAGRNDVKMILLNSDIYIP
jgi:hypothetical protein